MRSGIPAAAPPSGQVQGDIVVKAAAHIQITTTNRGFVILSTSTAVPISVVNAPSTTMTVDTSGFTIPTISNTNLSFGELKISVLSDNNLRVCGSSGRAKCSAAVIRMYTTGTAGSGLYNAADGYGMPILAKLGSMTALTVGLETANAAIMQSYTIPNSQNVFRLNDLQPAPVYAMSSDFTEAGAGDYSTTLVIEYGLLP